MTLFNENHKARIRVTFEAIDEMLSRALAMLDPAAPRSPFSMHISDATAEQFARFGEEAARFRAAMQAFMQRHGIPLAEPTLSSVWAARSALTDGGRVAGRIGAKINARLRQPFARSRTDVGRRNPRANCRARPNAIAFGRIEKELPARKQVSS